MDDKQRARTRGCGIAFFGLIALMAVVSFAAFSYGGSSAASGPGNTEACVMAQDFVRQRLKAPSTAKFDWCGDTIVTHRGDLWMVAGNVDAQNSFGAMLRAPYVVEMTYSPSTRTWHLDRLDLIE